MKQFYQKVKKNSLLIKLIPWNYFFIALIFFISIFNLRYFLKPGIFRGHDSENHLARIANYYLAIKDGHFPPRWARNLNHKFGYPVFNYNYPLANILAYPLIVVGFGIEESLKIILFAAYFFSGLFFYFWAKRHFTPIAALIGAVFYVCAPYQFLDIYVRGVVGENFSLALFPLVLYFINLCSEKITKIRFILLILVVAFFSLSHNIMVLMFSPLIFCYLFFLKKQNSFKSFKTILVALISGFLLTAFFWMPALLEKKYITLNAMDPKTFYLDHFINFKQLFYTSWQYGFSVAGNEDTMSFQLGIFHWTIIALSLFLLITNLRQKQLLKKEGMQQWLFIGQFFFWLSIILMLPLSSPIWRLIPFIGYIQFPWRFLSLSIFFSSLLAVAFTNKHKFIGLILMFLCLLNTYQFTKPFSWEKKSDYYYYDYLFTTSTRHENNPIWFSEENINTFKQRFTSTGLVIFKEISWLTGKHTYEIDASQAATIWEHTAYFPGWQAYIDNKAVKIKYNNREFPGLISFDVPKGKHLIVTRFTEKTPGRIIGDLLTSCALITTIFLLYKIKKTYA